MRILFAVGLTYFISIAFSAAILISCSRNPPRYYLKQQWFTTSSEHFPLKSKPVRVIEYFHSGVSAIDTVIPPTRSAYDLYDYDAEGNLLKRELYYGDSMGTKSIHQYTPDGYSINYFLQIGTDIKLQRSYLFEAVGRGEYRATKNPDSADKQVSYYVYKNNGDEVTIERWFPSKYQTVVEVYDGQRLLTRTMHANSNTITATAITQYYYGKDKGLDSIVEKGEDASRTIFTRNQQGDPVTELVINTRNDTLQHFSYTYRYDDKGNWIRRVDEDHLYTSLYSGPSQKYSLVIRQITY